MNQPSLICKARFIGVLAAYASLTNYEINVIKGDFAVKGFLNSISYLLEM